VKVPIDPTKDLHYYAKEQDKKLDKIIRLLSIIAFKPS